MVCVNLARDTVMFLIMSKPKKAQTPHAEPNSPYQMYVQFLPYIEINLSLTGHWHFLLRAIALAISPIWDTFPLLFDQRKKVVIHFLCINHLLCVRHLGYISE